MESRLWHGETDLTAEYAFLCICAAWLAYVAVSLVRAKHCVLGSISLAALAAGVWGHDTRVVASF